MGIQFRRVIRYTPNRTKLKMTLEIEIEIFDFTEEDHVEESFKEHLKLDVEKTSTFEDLKQMIKDKTFYETEDQSFLLGFVPIDSKLLVKDVCSSGDLITAYIKSQEAYECSRLTNVSEDPVILIVGSREDFKRIPVVKHQTTKLQGNILSKSNRFSIVKETSGDIGDKRYDCNVYQVDDGAIVELHQGQVLQYKGTLAQEVVVSEMKTFREADLRRGFLSHNMREALDIIFGVGRFGVAVAHLA